MRECGLNGHRKDAAGWRGDVEDWDGDHEDNRSRGRCGWADNACSDGAGGRSARAVGGHCQNSLVHLCFGFVVQLLILDWPLIPLSWRLGFAAIALHLFLVGGINMT